MAPCSLSLVLYAELLFKRFLWEGADEAVDELSVLKNEEGRDAHDLVLHRGLRVFVDVELGERHLALEFLGELVDDGAEHHNAGADGHGPGQRPEIADDIAFSPVPVKGIFIRR